MAKNKIISKKLLQQEKSQNQEIQEKSLSQSQEESIDVENDKITEKEPDNCQIPFQQFRKSFPIFNRKSRIKKFKAYAKLKSENFQKFKQVFERVSKVDANYKEIVNNKLFVKSQQNIFACEVPSKTTIFIHVYRLDDKRCHMRLMNASGYVFAYFVNMNSVRKFPKIFKILTKIGEDNLFMIMDQQHNVVSQRNYIEKIADYAQEFCYYCRFDLQSQFQKTQYFHVKEKIINKELKGDILPEANMYCFSSSIFKKENANLFQKIEKMIEIQHDIESSLDFTFEQIENPMNFILKSVLINYQKSNKLIDLGQMYVEFKKIMDQYQSIINKKKEIEFGNPEDHYPQKMQICKECVYCSKNRLKISKRYFQKMRSTSESSPNQSEKLRIKQIYVNSKKISKKSSTSSKTKKSSKKISMRQLSDDEDSISLKASKTKFRCQGCTATAKKDVPLCLDCFRGYHIELDRRKMRNIQKSKDSAIKRRQKESNIQHSDQVNQFSNYHEELTNQQFEQQELSNFPQSQREQNCRMCTEDSLYENQSQENDQRIYKNSDMGRKLQENNQFVSLLNQINFQRIDFLQIFYELYSDPQTKKIALTIIKYVQLKTSLLFSEERCQ